LVIWDDFSLGVRGRRYNSQGLPTTAEFGVSSSFSLTPTLAGDGQGGFLVVWDGSDVDGPGIFARHYRLCVDEIDCP
jgi:hypothetical protein